MENEERFNWRGFLLKALLVILFIFVLMWFFPFPKMEQVNDTLFNENMKNMKEVAKTYYTVDRLPKNVGDSVKMTLREMIDQNLILPIIDSNGKACNTTSSYVQVTKTDSEYLIKTNLSCPSRTAYVLEHLGCYDICSDKCKPTTVATTTVTKTVEKKETTETRYLYIYRKDTTSYKEVWSDWSSDIKYTDSDNIQFGCTDTKCIEKDTDASKSEYVGYKTVYKTDSNGNYIPLYNVTLSNYIGSYTISACASYNYVIYQNYGTYANTTSGWVDQGEQKYTYTPHDTPTEKYVYKGAGYDNDCTGTCSALYFIYEKYTLSGSTKITSSTDGTSISVTCGSMTTQEVKVYGEKKVFAGYQVDHRVDMYSLVTFYRYKTKSTEAVNSSDIQQRSKPDQSLINQGYHLIETRIIK